MTTAAALLTGASSALATPLPRPRPAIAPALTINSLLAPTPLAQQTPTRLAPKSALPPTALADKAPLPRKRPASGAAATEAFAQANVGLRGSLFSASATIRPIARPVSGPFAVAPTTTTSPADIAAVRNVIDLTRKGKEADAEAAKRGITDPVARKLAEWVILRSDNTKPPFFRYAAFINENPAWPHVPLFKRRAENALWNDKLDDNAVRTFFAQRQPTTAKGRLIWARALLAKGDRAGAENFAKYAWREDELSSEVERQAIEMFGSMITPADTRYRMRQRFYVGDTTAGLRAAQRLGGNDLLVAKAWEAAIDRSGNAKALFEAVPTAARQDAGYIFAKALWLRKTDKDKEAAALMMTAPNDAEELVDIDQWWVERRLLVRKLLDEGDAQTAYKVARDTPSPPKSNYRVDQHFTAGWIALRFLHDPAAAAEHFAKIPEGTTNPHALARAGYWQGRAAEAMNKRSEARAFYEAAGVHSATYYGQLARARLGLPDLGLKGPPQFTPDEHASLNNLEVVRAVEILYALDERDLIAPICAELGESATDIAGMAMLGEAAAKHNDGRAMLLLGKAAHSRGLPLDYYAFPTVGLPSYTPIAPPVEDAVTYSIARQESHFNQKVVSIAKAMGFMQVTPVAAKDTARKFKAPYDAGRLLSDPVYNMQMGAAELSNLIGGYRGSYLLTFAGYNAGRGRVRQWIAAHGDPREAKVDPIDWVEMIPIAE
ncbi:MAG: lytic transglycosylase domain-containing protein, partial [Pseudolabrys sp.]|nr:lytic transglycosylase domain-containing protein [Pseudolabrys sp.]